MSQSFPIAETRLNTRENKNKTIIIGDIHGRNCWKSIVVRHPNDEIVFVGDYFDSKEEISVAAQIDNFLEICALKKSAPLRVSLLLGNHDFHYLPQAEEKYSGYQYPFVRQIREALLPAVEEEIVEICVKKGKYLISHAGLTRTWCRNHKIPLRNPVEAVNRLFRENPEAFRFSPGELDEPTGNEPEQGPLWVRPYSLSIDHLPGFTHVVGHTQQADINILPHTICVDVLAFTPKYLEINEKGEAIARYFA